MNAILKSKSTRLLSALLAVLMIVAMLPTTAFAWSVEEGTKCTSTYGDHYVGSDGEMFYSKPTTTAIFYNDDGSYYVKSYASGNAKYKYMMIDESGNYHHVYCIEGGVTFDYSDTYNSTSGKNSKYFQNLPVTAQFGIMMALMYGYHEGIKNGALYRVGDCMPYSEAKKDIMASNPRNLTISGVFLAFPRFFAIMRFANTECRKKDIISKKRLRTGC